MRAAARPLSSFCDAAVDRVSSKLWLISSDSSPREAFIGLESSVAANFRSSVQAAD
jgi:hypothetical protein